MNRLLLTLLPIACLFGVSQAQTNAPAAASKNIEISSKVAEFDLKTRLAIHRGNVRVEAEGMQLACETLTAKLSAAGNRIENFVGEERVVIDLINEEGQKAHGTGDKVVYTYTVADTATNEIVELMGNPMLETVQGTLTGDVITLDRIKNKLRATNQKMVLRPEAVGATNVVESTNASPSQQRALP